MGAGFYHHSGRASAEPSPVAEEKKAQATPAVIPPPAVDTERLEIPAAEVQTVPELHGEYDMDTVEIYRMGDTLGVRGSSWRMSPKVKRSDLESAFQKSYYKAARDFGSNPPTSEQPLVHDKMLAERGANRTRVSPISFIDGGDAFKFQPWFTGSGFQYFVHLDMAKNRDAAGVAMGHYDRTEDKVVIDMMLTLRAPKSGELRLSRFRQLIFELTNLGFSIAKVTVDSWQSVETQQELRMKGYNVEQYSVDRTTTAYDTLVELMLAGKLDYYHNEIFIQEFNALSLIDGKKIDHPTGGSKDLADAVAAVCVHALEVSKLYQQRLPGVIRMAMNAGENSAGGANRGLTPGMPYVGGITQESLGRQGLIGERKLFAI